MDKILTSEGGYPLRLDDLDDLQQTLRGVLQGIATALGDGIISGCNMYSYQGRWRGSSGYISYKGNIYTSEGNILDLQPIDGRAPKVSEVYWVLTEHRDRMVVYEDGHEEPSRLRYRATLVVSKEKPTLPYFRAYRGYNVKRLGDYISKLKDLVDAPVPSSSTSESLRGRAEEPEERWDDQLRDHEPPGHA